MGVRESGRCADRAGCKSSLIESGEWANYSWVIGAEKKAWICFCLRLGDISELKMFIISRAMVSFLEEFSRQDFCSLLH